MRDQQPRPPSLAAIRAGARFAGGEASFQILDGPDVGEIQVLENFRSAPFPLRGQSEFLGRHAVDCIREHLLQSHHFGVHTV